LRRLDVENSESHGFGSALIDFRIERRLAIDKAFIRLLHAPPREGIQIVGLEVDVPPKVASVIFEARYDPEIILAL